MTKMGRYRYWGDQKPDTSRPLLSVTRPQEAVSATARTAPVEQPSRTGTLRIYGPVDSWGGWWGVSSKEVAQALDLLGDADRIIVRVNSPGGESAEGRAIVNLLRAHSAEIITVVDGAAYSAASYIAACGDDSVMSPGTTLMIHDTSTFLYGNADAMRKAADTLDVLSNSGAELYAEIAGGTVEEWRELQKAETWYTAASAVESGLMKRVATVPDVGQAETAGDDTPEPVDPDDIEERARASYDLSLFDKAPEGLTPKPPTASAGGSTPEGEESAVAFSDAGTNTLRTRLGVAEDADEATILAALDEALDERAEPDPSLSAEVPQGHTVIASAELETLRAGARAGAAAAATLHERDREAFLDANRAKYPTGLRDAWSQQYDLDPAAASAALSAMPDIIPVTETGHANEDDAEASVSDDPHYQNWRF
ncbi:MAG: Clp protease ClpP [Nocardioides sp.]|uniref:head maturation protease, ClpP-related n=1 Tax=Nocardioides sp. TaxID=35761 RepID=UPI0039E4DF03